MVILPAIDLYDKKAVRLYKGDYSNMKIYSNNPFNVALDFEGHGAKFAHIVDLEGAKDGTTPNYDIIRNIVKKTSLRVEVGGGIRNEEAIKKYLDAGVKRVIIGTKAVEDESFLLSMIDKYGDKISVGADIKDGYVATHGWIKTSEYDIDTFFCNMEKAGVSNIICTDISKDGAMSGTNIEMYSELVKKYRINITASGGISSLDDIAELKKMNIYGAIIGKAYYEKTIELKDAIGVADDN